MSSSYCLHNSMIRAMLLCFVLYYCASVLLLLLLLLYDLSQHSATSNHVHSPLHICSKTNYAPTNQLWLPVAGIGPNMLLARLATKRAKPNGQAALNPDGARALLGDLEVDALPGVGWSLRNRLKDMGITHVRQVRY